MTSNATLPVSTLAARHVVPPLKRKTSNCKCCRLVPLTIPFRMRPPVVKCPLNLKQRRTFPDSFLWGQGADTLGYQFFQCSRRYMLNVKFREAGGCVPSLSRPSPEDWLPKCRCPVDLFKNSQVLTFKLLKCFPIAVAPRKRPVKNWLSTSYFPRPQLTWS